MSESPMPHRPTMPGNPTANEPPVRQIDSRALLTGQSRIDIRHGNEIYRLCLTRQGKLILTK